MPQNAGHKEAAVWQPLPSLQATANKGFVRVQDARGQTSHFARWSYKHLNAPTPALPHQAEQDTAAHNPSTEAVTASAAPQNSAEIEQLKAEAYDRGLTEGRRLQQAEQAAQQQDLQVQQEANAEHQLHKLLEAINDGIAQLQTQPELRFEPLKRLAVHIAEELTLAELSVSAQGVQHLIERCLDVLDAPTGTQVLVELNPEDLSLLQAQLTEDMPATWRLQANNSFMRGSVQVSADDATVTDLVEHRLAEIAKQLLQAPQRWQVQSAFDPQRQLARMTGSAIQDAVPKEAPVKPAAEDPDHDD